MASNLSGRVSARKECQSQYKCHSVSDISPVVWQLEANINLVEISFDEILIPSS